jgi:hypothetical protein
MALCYLERRKKRSDLREGMWTGKWRLRQCVKSTAVIVRMSGLRLEMKGIEGGESRSLGTD